MTIFKIIFTTLLLHLSIYASNEYFSTANPVHSYDIKASASGLIVYTNEEIEGRKSNNNTIIEIDKELDSLELIQLKRKSKLTELMITIEKKNYDRLSKISSKPEFEKDNQKLKVLTLETNKADIAIKIASLEDKINKKTIKDNKYIYSISVAKGDYVNPGTLLYKAYDLSAAKLIVYIPVGMANTYRSKTIYIDGQKTDYKIDKIYLVADSKHISSYKCEIIINKPKHFSKLYKIEFK